MMERDWPHQVALAAYRCLGHSYLTMRFFCEGEGLSLSPHTHSLRRDDQDMLIFCFARRQHAEQFRDRFGGEFIDLNSRPKLPAARKSIWPREPLCARARLRPNARPIHRFQEQQPDWTTRLIEIIRASGRY